MRNKILFFSLTFLALLLIFSAKQSSAAPSNNPIFATIEYVEEKIQEVLDTFDHHEEHNETDFNLINQRADRLEEENEELKNKMEELENNSLPNGKWVHVCFDVATANLFVMKGGTCFPHVHWKVFVQCYEGTPCIPDNPADSYFDPPQEQ